MTVCLKYIMDKTAKKSALIACTDDNKRKKKDIILTRILSFLTWACICWSSSKTYQ